MKTLYIVDRTARQYPFLIDQLYLIHGKTRKEFTGNDESLKFLYDLIGGGMCFMLVQGENKSIFRGETLIGANITQN